VNHEVIDVHRARRLGIAATIFFLSCIGFNTVSTATVAAITPSIHAADYNLVNTGTHPITPDLLFPNETVWKDPDVECLIITNQDARFNSSGLLDPYPHAAYIRNAIKYYHQENGTEFVILGGDVNVIPIRYVYNPDNTQAGDQAEAFPSTPLDYAYTYKPTDHYYACLEGTWDNDNDGKFGEMGIVGTSVDEVDWTAEVYVGRIPAINVLKRSSTTRPARPRARGSTRQSSGARCPSITTRQRASRPSTRRS
jgi:hypothetical protein